MKNKENRKGRLTVGESLLLFTNFVWMVALYYATVILGERAGIIWPYQICTGLYCALAIILVALSGVYSGRIVSKKGGEERTDEQKAVGKRLILWALPLIAVLLIDIMDLFVVEYFKQLLSVAK